MKASLLQILVFLCSSFLFSQAKDVDSTAIKKSQLLKNILETPYDLLIGDISKSEKLTTKAVKIATELNDSLSLANAYINLSTIYAYKDKSEKKIAFSLKAIKIYESLKAYNKAGNAYGGLGFMLKNENLKDALRYMRKGIRLCEQNNASKIDALYDNYGVLQTFSKKYDSALYYHKKSLILKKKRNDSIGIPYGYAHLATINIIQKKFKRAKKFIDSSFTIRSIRKDTYGIADVYTYYGDLFFEQENYTKAIVFLKKGYDISKKNNFYNLQKYCAQKITSAYKELHDFKKAFHYNSIYQKLKDSTLNIKTSNKVAELKIEFETEKKEKEIAQQKKELIQQELEIKNRNLFSLLSISGLFILGIIAYGIYKKNKQLQKENELKDKLATVQTQNKLQEQRLRISRDLHDNIGSQLTFIISSIDNLKFLTKTSDDKLKSKLTNINNFASNTISQLRDTIWAMNKNEIPFEDFYGRVLGLIEKAKLVKSSIKYHLTNNVKSNIVFSSVCGINIFRVLQESINNALKYANASQISINIIEKTNTLNITIKDNGKGFDMHTVEVGNGLKNMERRMEEIDGSFQINSEKNKGTIITLTIAKNTMNAV